MKTENLIKEYKQTKEKKILDQIYLVLNPVIKQKAKFIFEKKFYPLSLYNDCYSCRICDKKNTDECKTCQICSCVKGTFNLKRKNLCEQKDVENDLWADVLRMIETYDITKSWDTYFYATLWNWRPTFMTKNFIKSLLDEQLETQDVEDKSQKISQHDIDYIIEIGKQSLTQEEQKILSMLLPPNELNENQMAKKLGISQQAVSKKLIVLRKKLKMRL